MFHFNVIFFGYAQACYIFTKIMQEPCFELRARSIPVSSYVDDGFTAAATRLACLWQALFAVLLQAVLGGFHGLAKCQIDPVLLIKWLGFMVDSVTEKFEVGSSKLEKLKSFLTTVLEKPSVSARDLAQVAGKIISLSPAVAPAALFGRVFFQAMKGFETWDRVFPNPEDVKTMLSFWLTNVDRFNGRPWWPMQPVRLQASVDASGVGFGGTLSAPSMTPQMFQGTFMVPKAQSSSTLREVLGYVGAVQVAANSFPDLLRGSAILITGDNQGAVSCINNPRSPVQPINQALQRLFNITSALRCDVLAKWVPWEQLQEADDLSRAPDASDWGISTKLFGQICRRFDMVPEVDLFGSDIHHTADIFVSRLYNPGCSAVDAFQLDWASFCNGKSAWIFPPTRSVSMS